MMKFTLKTLVCSMFLTATASSFAGLIENNENLRDDLNWLNQQGVIQISTSTWPLSSEAVLDALNQAQVTDPRQQDVIDSIKQQLTFDDSTLKLGASIQSKDKNVPQTFAENRNAELQGHAEFNAGGEYWDAKLRVNAEHDQIIENGNEINVEGSYIAGKVWNQWIAFGQMPTWWGPGHDGSLIRGDASRPVTGFTMQRAKQNAFESKWLSWIGPWQYQLYAGQLADYTAVPNTRLVGMRVTAQPLPYWEIAASRTFQIGGKGQPNSGKAYWNAFIGKDNSCETTNCVNDSNASNQLAGFDTRLNLQQLTKIPMGIYAQYIGEDEAGGFPSKQMYLAGLDYSSTFNNRPYQIYAEWADTRTKNQVKGVSYTHHQYKDGYYQNGYSLAHAIGGDGQMYSLGGNIRLDRINRLSGKVFLAKVNPLNQTINHAYPQNDELKGLDMTWSHTFTPNLTAKANGWWTKSDFHGNDFGGGLTVEYAFDQLFTKK